MSGASGVAEREEHDDMVHSCWWLFSVVETLVMHAFAVVFSMAFVWASFHPW